jgi:hypothetical protein
VPNRENGRVGKREKECLVPIRPATARISIPIPIPVCDFFGKRVRSTYNFFVHKHGKNYNIPYQKQD